VPAVSLAHAEHETFYSIIFAPSYLLACCMCDVRHFTYVLHAVTFEAESRSNHLSLSLSLSLARARHLSHDDDFRLHRARISNIYSVGSQWLEVRTEAHNLKTNPTFVLYAQSCKNVNFSRIPVPAARFPPRSAYILQSYTLDTPPSHMAAKCFLFAVKT
jgi:hypothetical protein